MKIIVERQAEIMRVYGGTKPTVMPPIEEMVDFDQNISSGITSKSARNRT